MEEEERGEDGWSVEDGRERSWRGGRTAGIYGCMKQCEIIGKKWREMEGTIQTSRHFKYYIM